MTTAEYNLCVDNFADGLFRFILKSLKDEDRSKDIIQDSFEKLWIKYSEVSFEKAKSYLFTTAYHTMIDKIRKDKPMERLDNTYVISENQKGYSDLKEILETALENLPEKQKTVVLLRDYEGYTYKEIEEITGLPESQVKVYIYRARKNLAKYIGSPEVVI